MAEDQPIDLTELTGSEIVDIRDFLSFRLHRLAIANDRHGHRLIMDRYGLTLPQWRVIGVIGALGPDAPVAHVLRDLSMNKSQLSREFKALSRNGLISSSTDTHDRRRLRVSLTGRGRRLYAEVLGYTRELNDAVLERLPPGDAAKVLESFDILTGWVETELARLDET